METMIATHMAATDDPLDSMGGGPAAGADRPGPGARGLDAARPVRERGRLSRLLQELPPIIGRMIRRQMAFASPSDREDLLQEVL